MSSSVAHCSAVDITLKSTSLLKHAVQIKLYVELELSCARQIILTERPPDPPLDIPNVGLYDFLFERKDKDFPDDKVIYVDGESRRSYTFAQVKAAAIDFGKGLKGLWDWQKGNVLALYTPNCIDTPAITWGTHWAGGIVSPANPGYTLDELVHQLKDSGARAIVTQLSQLDIAQQAAKKVGIPEERIALIGDAKHPEGRIKHFTSVRNISGTQRFRRAKIDADNDLAFLVYSSGTTGLPKGVMLSHRNIVANTMQITAAEGSLSPKPTENLPDGDAILAFLPFFHIYGEILQGGRLKFLSTSLTPLRPDLSPPPIHISWTKVCRHGKVRHRGLVSQCARLPNHNGLRSTSHYPAPDKAPDCGQVQPLESEDDEQWSCPSHQGAGRGQLRAHWSPDQARLWSFRNKSNHTYSTVGDMVSSPHLN